MVLGFGEALLTPSFPTELFRTHGADQKPGHTPSFPIIETYPGRVAGGR